MHPFLNSHRLWATHKHPMVLGAAAAVAALLWPAAIAQAASAIPAPVPGHTAAGPSPSPTPKPKTAAFGLGPATATALDDRPTFVWSVTPAGTLTDHVALVNYSTESLTLALYARDAFNAPSGALTLQAKSVEPTDAGLWIKLEIPAGASTVTVPPRSTVIVPIALTVPRNASPGDHTAGIITSLTSSATATNGNQTVNPNLEQRVAVPVEIRVSGPVHPKLAVQAIKASYSQTVNPVGGGHATVTYHVVNTGNVNLGGHEALSVSGLFGSTVHARAPDLPVLLPGASIVESVPVHGVLPEFLMSARVTISPLAASGNVDPGLISTSGSKHFWAVPWLLIGIIVLLLVAWRQQRRRRRPSTRRHGPRSGGGTRRRGSAPTPANRKVAEVAPGGIAVTNSVASTVRRLAAAALAAGLAMAVPAGTASASSKLPYTDSYAHGFVGLCDKHGNNITHGSVYDKPFVWRAVSSVPAPATFAGDGRKATLYAMQPRKGIDAASWSGDSLTASSTYTNVAVPIAQATDRDFALSDFLNEFAPQWDRLLELRIYFSAPEQGVDPNTYPAADIRVTGTTWTLVDGGNVNCNAGDATSPEQALPVSNTAGIGPPSPLGVVAAKAVGAPLPAANSSSPPVADTSPGAISQAADASTKSNSSKDVAIIAAIVIVAVLLGTVVVWRRRQSHVS